ncbi:isoamylase 2, chloroplastic [Andrographis paniculata]|uniref:isoamylase 2, chloroplastic n=1 Tax=Andrographis paniculata TaxID=175694 RepID=UPI0021E729EF|nr:isoamylase 2, chloroplastic [Andrographis paniculata]XP_051132865.1 isoamylase 2, chloroplastic [Andrographis paniculata]XP_051132866.1 isoamylase 2, chloroplastic [Andrographis paniculata]XP_051132867.1 isoamylase 2, chloroplastic [Andrographis paniculata]XP_051132868.1 isoamylase 2, chloroplastic [Andrographis paniculata]
MLPAICVMQPHCVNCSTFKSVKLLSPSYGKYRNRVAKDCQKLDFPHRAVREHPLKCVRKVSEESHALKALATPDLSVVKTSENVATYRFWMEIGGQLKVLIIKKNNKYVFRVEVEPSKNFKEQAELIMLWSIFRGDSTNFLPLDFQPPRADSKYNTVETPFVKDSVGRLSIELDFETSLAPFYVSMLLKPNSGSTIRSHRKENFVVPVGFFSGRPFPLGLSFSDDGYTNFSLLSRSAENVVLCLYTDRKGEKPALELDLDPHVNKTGDIWHASLDCSTFASYGYRCRTESESKMRHVLLDPYAKVLEDFGLGLPRKCLGQLCKEPTFDWSGEDRPTIPMEKLIVYRLNVARFTKDKSSKLLSGVGGSFYGVSEKLQHFKDLGVNAILLEPVFPFDKQKGPYFPWHFFSPANSYGLSGDSKAISNSMKEMVKKSHANGIEVFLEVVFARTAEDAALREIDNPSYYHVKAGEDFKSRNMLNCNYPIVQQIILESLRHWVVEYHIDGFCFVDASFLMKGYHGELLSRPPLVEAIAFDPILSKVKIIADSSDPHNMDVKEIMFPHWNRWGEMNEKFCFDVRNFLRGQGPISNLATRLCGSGDKFLHGRGPAFSLNYITRNSGLTLVDLVSFSSSNLESELSWNCGEEGATNKTIVLETRLKQIRNFLFILFVSLGVPVLNMGDECGQSCAGSPDYTDRKPLDWNALSSGFGIQVTQFISFLSSLKIRRSDLLQNQNFLKEDNIEWQGPDQSPPGWDDPSCKFLAMNLKVQTESSQLIPGSLDAGGDLFFAFNSSDNPEKVILPPLVTGTWVRLVDTALPYPGFFSADGVPLEAGQATYDMQSHSCILFESHNL